MSSPVDIVRQLHDLVDKTYTTSVARTPFELYYLKLAISEMCGKLTRAVEGPQTYTAILAGKNDVLTWKQWQQWLFVASCQETAALNVIVSLRVADLIASSPDRQLTVKQLSEKTGAAEEYLSEWLSHETRLNCLRVLGFN